MEHFDVVPDIITTSKSLGGGVPLSGVTTTREIADRAAELGFHQSSSHTDDPFLCAVGLANIQIVEREGSSRTSPRRAAISRAHSRSCSASTRSSATSGVSD
jgi:4-aminobutyrate aminotransferase-like enzyme